MNRRVEGFTLIELVIVIVLLGILAATVAPKFVGLEDNARQSVVEAGGAALLSASALQFAADNGAANTLSDILSETDGVAASGGCSGTGIEVVVQSPSTCNGSGGGSNETLITLAHCDDSTITTSVAVSDSFCSN